eukprot:TRINITY_DN9986_c0_g1_i1.p1 TRINITY_DN9986_c0_g1~~TRINITY_DN9986_c0_g1_i1.p1  ORF type:complete len:139 (+),score=32.73 TRINITY_DN9986_c0_g1_i1:140-556(+)
MGHSSVVSSLIKKGASVAVKDGNNETPMRIAMRYSQDEVIRIILCSNSWEQALQTGTEAETKVTATESLISDFPDLFEIVMDNCCTMDVDKKQFLFNVKYIEDYQTETGIRHKTAGMALWNPISDMVHTEKEDLFTII